MAMEQTATRRVLTFSIANVRTCLFLICLSVSVCAGNATPTPKPERDGSSVEKAVMVRGGIKAERAWLTEHLGYAPRINYEHATIVRERRIFSCWSFSTRQGKHRQVFFDTGDYVKHVRLPIMDPTR